MASERVYIVLFNIGLLQRERCCAIFSTYELAEIFCRVRNFPITRINGVPIDTGYANIDTGNVFIFEDGKIKC